MNFLNGENGLADCLRNGTFVVIPEYEVAALNQPFDSAVAIGRSIADTVHKNELTAALAINLRHPLEAVHDPVKTAVTLAESCGKPVVLTLPGGGMSHDQVREMSAEAESAGIQNFFCVTGDLYEEDLESTVFGHRRKTSRRYLDSVELIAGIRKHSGKRLIGAAVNPFKYRPADVYLQFYKMIRKLQSGADYLVCQVGWDMKKAQELQWFLQMRDINHPVIARVALLSREEIQTIHDGYLPGVHVVKSFAAALQRESALNANQCLAAQLERISLQAAGLRLLGYSGIQLTGIRSESTLKMILKRVGEAVEKYTDYDEWLEAWGAFHNYMEFSPIVEGYFTFNNLMKPQRRLYDASESHPVDGELPDPQFADRLRSFALAFSAHKEMSPKVEAFVRNLLCSGDPRDFERYRYSEYLYPSSCPKKLIYGACGGSAPDGICEVGTGECFFHRVLALANKAFRLDSLEEKVVGV